MLNSCGISRWRKGSRRRSAICGSRLELHQASGQPPRLVGSKTFISIKGDAHRAWHLKWSGCRDLNPGPSVPQTDALTKLRHSP